MPVRTTANNRQREFFKDLSNTDELVLATKNGEFCSMNVHGSFELFDKNWHGPEQPQNETMIALKEKDSDLTHKEPPVHFYIDWREIRWICIRPRQLDLINFDHDMVFCRERDTNTRVFWFYPRESFAVQLLRAK